MSAKQQYPVLLIFCGQKQLYRQIITSSINISFMQKMYPHKDTEVFEREIQPYAMIDPNLFDSLTINSI